jgi:sporulation protein YlmC with PRC-barrel domain
MSSYTTPPSSDLSKAETPALIAASKVSGTNVYNRQGDSLGSIYDVMINKHSGQVTYAVMSFGGFLGMGEKYHPLPWNKLSYSEQHGGYVIDLDKRQLEAAPSYGAYDAPDWSTDTYGTVVDKYYDGLPTICYTSDSNQFPMNDPRAFPASIVK